LFINLTPLIPLSWKERGKKKRGADAPLRRPRKKFFNKGLEGTKPLLKISSLFPWERGEG